MPKFYTLRFFYFVILLVFSAADVSAQLPGFTLVATPTDEACPGNGSLAFNVSGTVPGASVLYNIYKFPNLTTPIATLAANTFGGLTAGTYRVIATQSLNGQTSSQQQDAEIDFTYLPLTYSLDIESCGTTSEMTIDVTQGIGVSYEIFGGPMIFPPQPSNVFSGLVSGNYQIRVYDNCGSAFASSYTLVVQNTALTIAPGNASNAALQSCDLIGVQNQISAVVGGAIAYPLLLQYTIYPPTGPPITITNSISVGGATAFPLTTIPFYHGQTYSYNLTVTDWCGNVYTQNGNTINATIGLNLYSTPQACSGYSLVVSPVRYDPPYYITFVSAPAGFDPLVHNASHPGPFSSTAQYYNPAVPLPPGSYTVSITDSCGRTATNTYTLSPQSTIMPLATSSTPGCDPGVGSIVASSSSGPLTSIIMTSAPLSYPQQLPYDVTFNLDNGVFYMNGLPAGHYMFNSIDECGSVRDTPITINVAASTFNATVTSSCNSFSLLMQHSSNINANRKYYLQKFDPLTNQWVHPATGVGGPIPNMATGLPLQNNTLNINLQFTGTFRIMFTYEISGNGSSIPETCVQELYNFEFNNAPQIIDVISYSCSPTTYDVVIEAMGEAPLQYRIVAMDGAPYLFENGNSNLFTALAPAVYTFQVEDACGNLMNRVFDTTEPFDYVVTATGFCDGQIGALSVPAFSFINYEWWHDGNPALILSTSPVLQFSPFDSSSDTGLYHVRVFAPNSTPSCIDFVVDYEIMPQGTLPQAGQDVNVVFCENPGAINLFSVIDAATDTSGTWQNLDSGIVLDGSLWNATNFATGTFNFGYTVNGWCGATDTASVTIQLDVIPMAPVASVDQTLCEGETLQLFADGTETVQYQWTGPNGFASNDQNPVIDTASVLNSGVYSVTASNGNCDSVTATVEVTVNAVPEISVVAACINDIYTLTVVSDAALPENALYTWNGPENYSAVGNSIAITQFPPGNYSVSVDYGSGCPSDAKLQVGSTTCTIPLGISPNGDGNNDMLDLSDFDAKKIKIFNRYGMVVFENAPDEKQWDGRDYNGNALPTASYFYIVTLNSGEQRTGWVYLIR